MLSGGAFTIEKLAQTDCIMFDKTGTLTEMCLGVEEFYMNDNTKHTKHDLWTMICALEEYGAAGHPVGTAIFAAGLKELGASWLEFKAHGSVRKSQYAEVGGLSGEVALRCQDEPYHSVCVGSRRYLESCSVVGLGDKAQSREKADGTILVHLAVDGVYTATLTLSVSIPSRPNY